MSRAIVLGLVLCAAVARATEIAVSIEGPVPFTEEELRDAVAMRLDESLRDRLAVFVAAGPNGAVIVRRGDELRSIDIGARVGGAAARLVALGIVDLAMAPAEPPPLRAALDRSRNVLALSVFGGLGKGTDDADPLGGCLGVDATVAVGQRLRFGVAAAWHPAATQNGTTVEEGVFRATAGVAFGPVELLGGPVVAIYDADAVVSNGTALLPGFGLAARARVSVPRGFSMYLAGGLDVFFARLNLQEFFGNTVFVSPPFAATVLAGLSYEIGL